VNPALAAFLGYSAEDRRDFFEATADDFDTVPTYVEKDFWVCLTLDALYNGPTTVERPRLLFKGGTSLSKVFQVINRFSEDVDVVVFPEDLGFTEERDPTASGLSRKKRGQLVEELMAAASGYICGQLYTDLQGALPSCAVDIDEDDRERSTLLVQYPTLYEQAADVYVRPRVKIEGGARSALAPHAAQTIEPYVASRLPETNCSIDGVLTLGAERTFWEKALILHAWHCGHRDEGRVPEDRHRLSRHYYDVAMMAISGIADAALADLPLLYRVRDHNLMFFSSAWMKFVEAVPGSLRLLPQEGLRDALEKDYAAMTGMILGTAPEFQTIMSRLEALQRRIDKLAV
jgi:hypothetical protein